MTGRKADVIKAAHLCAEAALRLVKPGNQVNKKLLFTKVSCINLQQVGKDLERNSRPSQSRNENALAYSLRNY